MRRCVQGWERMIPVGAGEVGRRGLRQEEPLFPAALSPGQSRTDGTSACLSFLS